MDCFVDYALGEERVSCNPPELALQILKLTLGEL